MLSVLATLPLDKGGMDASVIYIDTEAAFSAKRSVLCAFVGIISKETAAASVGNWSAINWDDERN